MKFTVESIFTAGLHLGWGNLSQRAKVSEWGDQCTIGFQWLDQSNWEIEYVTYWRHAVIKCSGNVAARALPPPASQHPIETNSGRVSDRIVNYIVSYERQWETTPSYGSRQLTERCWSEEMRHLWAILDSSGTELACGEIKPQRIIQFNWRFVVQVDGANEQIAPIIAAIALAYVKGTPTSS